MIISVIRVTALASINARFVRGLQAARRRRKEALTRRRAEAAVRRGEIEDGPNDDFDQDVDELRASEDPETYEKKLKAAAYTHQHSYTIEVS